MLAKTGPGHELERLLAEVEDVVARDVEREQVGRELDALERAVDRGGDGAGQHRLADARHVEQEHVAARAHGGEHPRHDVGLAEDDALDVLDHAAELRAHLGDLRSR